MILKSDICIKWEKFTFYWLLPANPITQDKLSSCCLFSLSPKIQPKNILRALLWVHLRPADMVTNVFLQISRLKPGKEGNNTRVRVRSLKIDTDTAGVGSWQSVDIKSLLQTWLRQPETNYGIEINAYDSKGEDLAVTSSEPGEEGLVRQMKDGTCKETRLMLLFLLLLLHLYSNHSSKSKFSTVQRDLAAIQASTVMRNLQRRAAVDTPSRLTLRSSDGTGSLRPSATGPTTAQGSVSSCTCSSTHMHTW